MKRKPDLAEHIERFSARGAGAREKADANRAADPEMAAWLDDMRSMFAAELARVEWPDGRTWGTVQEARVTMNAGGDVMAARRGVARRGEAWQGAARGL